MSSIVKIAIVDDHQIVLDGLTALINGDELIQLEFTTTDATQVLSMMQSHPIDVLITDIMMPGYSGIQLSKDVKQAFPQVKILALSMDCDFNTVDTLINDADIAGYALKNIDKDELSKAILKIANDGVHYSPEVLEMLKKVNYIKKSNEAAQLTKREIEIIQLIEQEFSNKDIAESLFISERTVETHRKNIIRKTKVHSVIGLVKYAYEHNLIPNK